MTNDIYKKLRDTVGRHSAFFPASKSGIELQFLKKLFNEEEAEMYMDMSKELETPQDIALRTGRDTSLASELLKKMALKGLVFPKQEDGTSYYMPAPFAHGLLENQVNRADRELAEIYEEYIWAEKIPEERAPEDADEPLVPLRSIPIKAPISIDRPIAPYEDVREIIMNQDRIAVAKCFCAVQQGLLDGDCGQPLEVCLMLGFYADYYIDLGFGRKISREEALDILDTAEEAGLVHQIPNSKDPGAICNCCPDCCGGLRVLKKLPSPALLVTTNYYCEVAVDKCTLCAICADRCPMDAITVKDGPAGVNVHRCIGCGLCINKCPEDALTLISKPDELRSEPPFTLKFMRSSQDIEKHVK